MKKDSEYLEKNSPAVIKVGVPTESDLLKAQIDKAKQIKVKSEPISSPTVLRQEGLDKVQSEPLSKPPVSGEERLYQVESQPLSPPPVSHSKRLYNVCKKGVSYVTDTVVESGRLVYRGGKIEINMPLVLKKSNPAQNKSLETPQQIVTTLPAPPLSYLLLKNLATPTTIVSLLLTVAVARQPIRVLHEVTRQFSALYVRFKEIAPPAYLRKFRQLIDADRFVNDRATFTVSGEKNKPRRADILIHKTNIFVPSQELERGSIYISNKQIANTLICQRMYGKIIKTSDYNTCELAFDLSVRPCFKCLWRQQKDLNVTLPESTS
jgi:hypothetical protein